MTTNIRDEKIPRIIESLENNALEAFWLWLGFFTPRQLFESRVFDHDNFAYMLHSVSEDTTFWLLSLHTIWKPKDYTPEQLEEFRFKDHTEKDLDVLLSDDE